LGFWGGMAFQAPSGRLTELSGEKFIPRRDQFVGKQEQKGSTTNLIVVGGEEGEISGRGEPCKLVSTSQRAFGGVFWGLLWSVNSNKKKRGGEVASEGVDIYAPPAICVGNRELTWNENWGKWGVCLWRGVKKNKEVECGDPEGVLKKGGAHISFKGDAKGGATARTTKPENKPCWG